MVTEVEHKERYGFVGVRLIKGQLDLLDECVRLTGQNRTDLIREALAGFLPNLVQSFGVRGTADEKIH